MDPHAADPMLRLLRGAVRHGHLHVDELQADLHQIVQLISDAIERLSHNFSRITMACAAPCAEGASTRDDVHDLSLDLEARLAEIADAARLMTTELQCHDLVSQVAARAQARLDSIETMLQALDRSARGGQPGRLAHAGARLERDSDALINRLRKAVAQRDLETGDIELF